MNQPRSHYQKHDGNLHLKRPPVVNSNQSVCLGHIEYEITKLRNATTKAAYDLRVQRLKQLIKSL